MWKTTSCLLSLPLLLSGCQTWGPTWSEVSGQRRSSGEIHQFRRPAIIEKIDDQGTFPSHPVKVEPGIRRIVLGAPAPGWPGGAELKVLMLEAVSCKRYYLNAQFENDVGREWVPVIDYVEDIAGCKIEAKK